MSTSKANGSKRNVSKPKQDPDASDAQLLK